MIRIKTFNHKMNLSDDEIKETLMNMTIREILDKRQISNRYREIIDDNFWCRLLKRDHDFSDHRYTDCEIKYKEIHLIKHNPTQFIENIISSNRDITTVLESYDLAFKGELLVDLRNIALRVNINIKDHLNTLISFRSLIINFKRIINSERCVKEISESYHRLSMNHYANTFEQKMIERKEYTLFSRLLKQLKIFPRHMNDDGTVNYKTYDNILQILNVRSPKDAKIFEEHMTHEFKNIIDKFI
jgi:hypothetical protein